MSALTGFAQRGLLYLLLAQIGILSLAWNALAWLLDRVMPRPRARVLGRAAIAWVYRVSWRAAQGLGLMRIDADALGALADEPGSLIIAANHPTMLDAMVIVARLPRGVCIMKAELMRNIFLGPASRMAGYICNDSAQGMVRSAVRCLREGAQLVVFPEGTRTVRPPINPFRPGLTLIAQVAQVPIQTVLIETDTPYLRKGWPIWRVPALPVTVRLRLGERFAPEADHGAQLARLERYFQQELAP